MIVTPLLKPSSCSTLQELCAWFMLCCFLLLTYWGQDKMIVIFQTTFSNAISCMKMVEFRLKFHWNLSDQQYSSTGSDNGLAPTRRKPLSEPMLAFVPTHICITQPQWVEQQMILAVSFKITSLTLEYSYDCPKASAVTLKNLGKYTSSEPMRNYNETNKNKKNTTILFAYFVGYNIHVFV